MIDDFLPVPIPRQAGPAGVGPHDSRCLIIEDFPPGNYELQIDGITLITADAADWKAGIDLKAGPEFDQVEALRAAINRKNDLFFYRWRPQNVTYLFGFRKYEQGNNAVEIPRFDPLVADQEQIIARLKKPTAHVYELSRVRKEVER